MTADEIKVIADSEMETGRSMAIGLGIVSVAFLVIAGGATLAVVPNLLFTLFLVTVFIGSAAVTGALFWAWRRRNRIIAMFMGFHFPTLEPAPPALPLPPAPEIAKAETDDSRGGYAERKLHGIPAITLEWVCNYIANPKNSWAEARLENMPVPYLYPIAYFGKAEKNSLYNQMFHPDRGLFCRAGIIGERGGPGNDKGKLLVSNPVEMMERIKSLPEE